MVPVETQPLRIGVLALQGSFREHAACLKKLGGVNPVEVRTKAELESVDGLIVPGGESTTMALIAERWGLLEELRAFSTAGRPVWGTCAGLIFLASNATGQKTGGQQLLGGINCCVSRNFFGAQINSFEAHIDVPSCFADRSPFRAVFIRAPAVLETGPDVEVLATYHLTPEERQATGRDSVVVGVRSKQLLATAFHPELTEDLRWHELFVDMVAEHIDRSGGSAAAAGLLRIHSVDHLPNRPADIPVYGDAPRW